MAWHILILRKYPNNLLFIQNPDFTVGLAFSFAKSAAWDFGLLHNGPRSALFFGVVGMAVLAMHPSQSGWKQ